MSKSEPDFLTNEYYQRLLSFLSEMKKETYRGQALVIASLLEQMLEETLDAGLQDVPAKRKLFDGPTAPVSSLYSKTKLACAMGLINADEERDIDIIRSIRNEFAHNIDADISNPHIENKCKSLKLGLEYLDALDENDESRVEDPEARFMMVATSIVTRLYNRAHYVTNTKTKFSGEFPI